MEDTYICLAPGHEPVEYLVDNPSLRSWARDCLPKLKTISQHSPEGSILLDEVKKGAQEINELETEHLASIKRLEEEIQTLIATSCF